MGQLTRAIEQNGPSSTEELAALVGAAYWEPGRFERALNLAIADGLIVRGEGGVLQPSV
jgi:predicted transcriptional regulator